MKKNSCILKFRSLGALVGLALLCAYPPQSPGQTPRRSQKEFVDHVGRKVVLHGIPKRIVSLAPSVTETLFALGLEQEIVGVTDYCDYPEAARRKTKVGGLLNPNYEVIVSLRPDLVIATMGGNLKESVAKISRLGIPIYMLNALSVAEALRSIRDVGEITGKKDVADKLVDDLGRRLQDVRARVKGTVPKRVLFLVWYDPIIAPGKKSFITDALSLAGGASITADAEESYPRYSLEQIIIKKPDYLFIAKNGHKFDAKVEKEAGWRAVPAVRNRRVYFLDQRIQHPSPRLVDAIEEVAGILYPEVFP